MVTQPNQSVAVGGLEHRLPFIFLSCRLAPNIKMSQASVKQALGLDHSCHPYLTVDLVKCLGLEIFGSIIPHHQSL